MSNPVNSQSQKRKSESLAALFTDKKSSDVLFLKSSSDVGVMRNGGRNGARFAPESLLATFKKLSQSEKLKSLNFAEFEVSSLEEEKADFAQAQELESKRIEQILSQNPKSNIIHLGGGHDHIYPLLSAMGKKKLVILNIDAHADTRTDDHPHSGTPFRQIAHKHQQGFHLFQIGLHAFANSFSTLSPLSKGESQILWRNEIQQEKRVKDFFDSIKKVVDQETLVVFSLDADALKGDIVPGVSAVNGNGLSLEELQLMWKFYRELSPTNFVLGIYELNPVYDTLSSLSMRTISAFLYESVL